MTDKVIAAIVADGFVTVYEANPLGGADQLAKVRVPVDFSPERALALTMTLTGIVADEGAVTIRQANSVALEPRPALPIRPSQRPTSGGGNHYGRPTNKVSATDVRNWFRAHPDAVVSGVDLARILGCDALTANARLGWLRKNGELQRADKEKWRYVGVRIPTRGVPVVSLDDPTDQTRYTQVNKAGKPRLRATPRKEVSWARLPDFIAAHPDGVTNKEIAEHFGCRQSKDAASAVAHAMSKGIPIRKELIRLEDQRFGTRTRSLYFLDRKEGQLAIDETATG